MRQKKSYKIPLSSFCWPSWLSAAGPGACPLGMVCTPSETLLERLVSPFERLLIGDSFLVGDGSLCLLLCISTGTPSGLELCRPVCGHSLCGSLCVSPVVSRRPSFLGVLHSLWILQSFHPLFRSVPLSSEGRDWIRRPLRAVFQGRSRCPGVGLCSRWARIQRPFSASEEGWALSYGVSLKSSQTEVGYYHNVYATPTQH